MLNDAKPVSWVFVDRVCEVYQGRMAAGEDRDKPCVGAQNAAHLVIGRLSVATMVAVSPPVQQCSAQGSQWGYYCCWGVGMLGQELSRSSPWVRLSQGSFDDARGSAARIL